MNREDDHVAACKLVSLNVSTSAEEHKTVEREMRVHTGLKHANVLVLLNAVVVKPEHGDIYVPGYYILLEWAAGGNFFEKIGESSIDALVGMLKAM